MNLSGFLGACGGFLAAVLWMDLMFDVQVLGDPSAAELESIVAYYRRATIDGWRMSWVVAAVMFALLAGVAVQIWRSGRTVAHNTLIGLSIVVPIALALTRVLPQARRLGSGELTAPEQVEVATEILYLHVGCLVAVIAFIALQLRRGDAGLDVRPRT